MKDKAERGLCAVTLRQLKSARQKALAKRIIAAGETVWQLLGAGHSEAIYQKAMEIETRDLDTLPLQICPVLYRGQTIGHHVPDLLCGGGGGGAAQAVVELKVAQSIAKAHLAQLGAYMRLLDLELGVLLNFPSSLEDKFSYELLQYKHVLTV